MFDTPTCFHMQATVTAYQEQRKHIVAILLLCHTGLTDSTDSTTQLRSLLYSQVQLSVPLLHSQVQLSVPLLHSQVQPSVPLLHSQVQLSVPLLHSQVQLSVPLLHSQVQLSVPL